MTEVGAAADVQFAAWVPFGPVANVTEPTIGRGAAVAGEARLNVVEKVTDRVATLVGVAEVRAANVTPGATV